MIVILKYSIRDNIEFNKILEKLRVDYSFTLNESVIAKATHIILPDTFNLHTAIRKMQLMNLFSMLRMIKKPILGINNGFNLMCNNITDIQKLGLGLFPINTNSCKETDEEGKKKGEVSIIKNTAFLEKVSNRQISCNLNRSASISDFATSTVLSEGKQFSLTCEYENYFSIQTDLRNNTQLFELLIANFVNF